MKAEEFFPKVQLSKNKLIFSNEALETMELDVEGSKVILLEITDPEKTKNNKEIVVMKTNGSLCDDVESIKDVINPQSIREVKLTKENNEILYGEIEIPDESLNVITALFGKESTELKLLVCNTESALGKEFKEQFDITGNYYSFANMNDKRVMIGKNKDVKKTLTEERIKIN